jgi:hypothetical protein
MRRELKALRLLCLQGTEAAAAGLHNLRDSMCGQALTHPADVSGQQLQLAGHRRGAMAGTLARTPSTSSE